MARRQARGAKDSGSFFDEGPGIVNACAVGAAELLVRARERAQTGGNSQARGDDAHLALSRWHGRPRCAQPRLVARLRIFESIRCEFGRLKVSPPGSRLQVSSELDGILSWHVAERVSVAMAWRGGREAGGNFEAERGSSFNSTGQAAKQNKSGFR
jgi:hypothetical protein